MKLLVCFSLVLSLLHLVAPKAPKLARYDVDSKNISVSGFSSGAFFAVQFHVAFSSTIMGMGAVAGGPFWCAESNLNTALTACMKTPAEIVVSELVTITYTTARTTQTIDDPQNMKNHKVYLFSGTKDTVVVPGVVTKLAQYYSNFTPNGIASEFDLPAEHSIVTSDYGNACGVLQSPFINNCGYPTAYHILQHIYGDIQSTNTSAFKEENLLMFDQAEFLNGVPKTVSMDTTGYVYVPAACQDRARKCRLHIAFHGCEQGRAYVSDVFARHAGYNGLAELNNIIVLYPQVTSSTLPFNPHGCWDWWGYTGVDYASNLGLQMLAVKKMLNRIVD